MHSLCLASCLAALVAAADPAIRSDRPYPVAFPAEQAKYVRVLIHETSNGEPCIDELEVLAPDGKTNLALAARGAKASASSCLGGYPQHTIEHLNDGLYGNAYSWIPQSIEGAWAQIELPQPAEVAQVVVSRDRERQYSDRVPVRFEVQLSLDGVQWKTVRQVKTTAAAVAVGRGPGGFAGVVPSPPPPPVQEAPAEELLRDAMLAEEHAWLKTYGRADLSPVLVPYNGRVKEYPHHVGDDVLPLPTLAESPKIDGKLDDPCWAVASRGVARVAWPYDFATGPLIEYSVQAGRSGDDLVLAIRTNRLLSSHVAVVSSALGDGCGVLVCQKGGAVFQQYKPGATPPQLADTKPVEAASDPSLTAWEFRLPLAWFDGWQESGIRIGLGMGGKHTPAEGRPVTFFPSPLAVAEAAPCRNRTFQLRLTLAADAKPVTLHGSHGPLVDGVALAPGESKTIAVAADGGPIGPQCNLSVDRDSVDRDGGQVYRLHLLRYDPLERTLALMESMLDRLAAKGLDVGPERSELAGFRQRQQELQSVAAADVAAEREAFAAARLAKRRLFFREPELDPIANLLFVKRHAYEPSHNYSVMLDSRWRPGGGVYRLEIPRVGGRLEPGEGKVVELFKSGEGIARDPMANFDLSKIYFGYRPSEGGYYHVMQMEPDGGGVKQLTSGPFHDYWPCPLPDGGLAFIGTRCTARYLCWRPQVAVLFRMDADGENIRPLSFSNLSEWGPSVMSDGRLIWTRSEYIDKGADFSHTLWAIRPDGVAPQLIFGNTIIQPNGYANGREVPGSHEICCTLISHFGDLNGPIALVDIDKGRFNPKAITSITPEVPWPGMWPSEECFRDPVPVAHDYFLCSHAPRQQFGLYVIDRFGNREMLYLDPAIGAMCPTPYRPVPTPPAVSDMLAQVPPSEQPEMGQFTVADVYRGISPAVARGKVKYLRVVEEVRAQLQRLPNGEYRKDHEPFMHFYAAPTDIITGPYGWPSYVAKAPWGIVPVEEDGSANFLAPAGRTLYFQVLDENFNELQRMRSVVQLQPGEQRSCIGCHEDRRQAPPAQNPLAMRRPPSQLEPPPWGAGPFSYEKVVQPVWDAKCVQCHNAGDPQKIDLSALLDQDRVPASYKTLIRQGWVHYLDCGWNSGGNEKREPMTFGTVQSKLFQVLDRGHYGVELSREEMHRVKCWIDMNCPLWPDYLEREDRPAPPKSDAVTALGTR